MTNKCRSESRIYRELFRYACAARVCWREGFYRQELRAPIQPAVSAILRVADLYGHWPPPAGMPERCGDLVARRSGPLFEEGGQTILQAEPSDSARVVFAPRSSNLRAAFHCANMTASDIAVPFVKMAPGLSILAPPSSRALRASTSLLLAAQWRGLSGALPPTIGDSGLFLVGRGRD